MKKNFQSYLEKRLTKNEIAEIDDQVHLEKEVLMVSQKIRPTFADFKKEALQDPAIKAAYDLLELEFALLDKRIEARREALTNKENLKKAEERIKVQQLARQM